VTFDEIIAAELELDWKWAYAERAVCGEWCDGCWASYAKDSTETECRPGCFYT
jgi:hypothetical protein